MAYTFKYTRAPSILTFLCMRVDLQVSSQTDRDKNTDSKAAGTNQVSWADIYDIEDGNSPQFMDRTS